MDADRLSLCYTARQVDWTRLPDAKASSVYLPPNAVGPIGGITSITFLFAPFCTASDHRGAYNGQGQGGAAQSSRSQHRHHTEPPNDLERGLISCGELW